ATIGFAGAIAGLLPALQAWQPDARLLGEQSRGSAGGPRQSRLQSLLVASQIALVLPLLVAAVLLTRSFSALAQVDPGFRAANVQTFQLAIPRTKYPDDADVAAICTRLLERIGTLPGVSSAGMVNRLPLGGVGQINPIEFELGDGTAPQLFTDTRSVT